jgi:hypothetical protein
MYIYSLQGKINPHEGVYKCAFLPWTASTDTPKVVLTKYFFTQQFLAEVSVVFLYQPVFRSRSAITILVWDKPIFI